MANWRLARSLINLRSEVNEAFPNRSKTSDGSIGDTAHSSRSSDHNPNRAGVVCAVDLTHDPANGADMGVIAERLRTHRHPSLTYLIFNRRIASAVGGWKWRPYKGSNPHTKHLHVSASHDYDNPAPWGVLEEDDMTDDQAAKLVAVARAVAAIAAKVDEMWNTLIRNAPASAPLGQITHAVHEVHEGVPGRLDALEARLETISTKLDRLVPDKP